MPTAIELANATIAYQMAKAAYSKALGSEEQASRVRVCKATLEVMRKCFFLLGMEPLDRI